ncbi:B12-binding domain-containing radical SAM protein [bacterium]|nr:B12-binding domain-containing radical SAM protein [bacterium]
MKILLIAPYPDITALGVRYLSSQLEREGFSSRVLFIPGALKSLRFRSEFRYRYSPRELDEIGSFARDAELIGLSFMSNYLERAIQLTRHLKGSLKVPIVWGGVHATACPEESLDYADVVCRGEGEQAFIEFCHALSNDRDVTGIANFWTRKDRIMIRNEVRALIQDLDGLAFPDYRFNVHGVLDRDNESVRLLDEETTIAYLAADAISTSRDSSKRGNRSAFYQLIATRGCPHQCTFCYNSEYRKMYGSHQYLRRRSVGNIIEELVSITKQSPSFRSIVFCDDSFFATNEQNIAEFAALYQEKIGLPFHCLGSPQTITRQKMDHLVRAGLRSISMGIQSGSRATNEIYQRRFKEEEVLAATRLVHSYQPGILPPAYDFIIDNPFETIDDQRQTLEFILKIPRPHHLCLGSLVFFPGTILAKRALEAGWLIDTLKQVYRKEYHHKQGTYLNFLFYLASFQAPITLLRFLLHPIPVRFFQLPIFKPLFWTIFRGTRFLRIVRQWLKLKSP